MEVNIKATQLLDCLDQNRYGLYRADRDFFPEYEARHTLYIRQFLQRSQKFYAGELESIPETEIELDTLKLPFPETYIEAPMDLDEGQDQDECYGKGRMIFLCTEHETEIFKTSAPEGWKYLFGVRILLLALEPFPKMYDSLHVVCIAADQNGIPQVLPFKLSNKKNISKEDMEGERVVTRMYFRQLYKLFHFLALLSCSNIGSRVIEPGKELNKKRLKKGEYPFFRFRVLTIQQHYSVKRSGDAPELDGSKRASPCLHWRRGHIRRIHGGEKKIWVAPSMVGEPSKAILQKHYQFKP